MMADIRPKNLLPTADRPAPDDYLLLDGGAEGTRKMLAASSAMNVRRFGAVGDGVADDTAAFQAMIDAAMAESRWLQAGQDGAGYGHIACYIPAGTYRITKSLLPPNVMIGVLFQGDGSRSSLLLFDTTADALFDVRLYQYVTFRDIGFQAGAISFSGGKLVMTAEGAGVRSAVCFKFLNALGGGSVFHCHDCLFQGFGTVFETKSSTVNQDDHRYSKCSFMGNDYVWDNTNEQALNWSFQDCKFHHIAIASFRNPASFLQIYNADVVSPGNFCEVDRTAGFGNHIKFDGLRMEHYQNFNEEAEPQVLVLDSAQSATNIEFINCTNYIDGIYNKGAFNLSGLYSITFRNCSWRGIMKISANASDGGSMSAIRFIECTALPTLDQTLDAGQNGTPVQLTYERCRSGGQTSQTTRHFSRTGGYSGVVEAASVMTDQMHIEATLNNNGDNRDFPIFCPPLYRIGLIGVKIVAKNNTAEQFTITLWDAPAKSRKILEVKTAISSSGVFQFFDARASNFLAPLTITSASPSITMTVSAERNAGLCRVMAMLEWINATI